MKLYQVLCVFCLSFGSLSSAASWFVPRNRSEGLIFCCVDDVDDAVKKTAVKPLLSNKKGTPPAKVDEVIPPKGPQKFDPKDFDIKDFHRFHESITIKRRRPSERGCIMNTQPGSGCHWFYENGNATLECSVSVAFGTPAEVGEFPYMVAVGFPSGSDISWSCGGTLISDKYVVTAAHCAYSRQTGSPPSVIRLGAHNITGTDPIGPTAFDSAIERIIVHPNYTLSSKYHDIALIELSTQLRFDDYIRAACLWHYPDLDFQGRLTAIGWGTTGYGKKQSDILLKGLLDIIPKQTCQNMVQPTKQYPLVTDDQVCALDLTGKPGMMVDTCKGDSGGPLLTKDSRDPGYEVPYIVGVTSFGKICTRGSPGIYTRISSYVPWIESIVWPDT